VINLGEIKSKNIKTVEGTMNIERQRNCYRILIRKIERNMIFRRDKLSYEDNINK
jgi:hypothetical protein